MNKLLEFIKTGMATLTNKSCRRKAHFTFVWTIENAPALLLSGFVESPSFVIQSIDKTKWMLACHSILDENLRVVMRREEDNGPDSIEIECELSFLAIDGTPLYLERSKFHFKIKTEGLFKFKQDRNEIFFLRKAKFSPNDALTVRCRMWKTGSRVSKADTCFARTRLRADKRAFVWAIREFSSLEIGQNRTHLLNPTLPGSPQLILSFFLSERDGETYVNIEIDQNSATIDYWCILKISLLDSDGKVVHSKEYRTFILKRLQNIQTFECFFEKDKIMNEEYPLLQNDVLFLRCEFTLEAKPEWNQIENYSDLNIEKLESAKSEILETHLDGRNDCFTATCPFKKTLEDLYEDESLCDVSIRTGATLLHAHKNVLSARSPVFKAMFTQDMREKSSKIVDIPDFEADTMCRLLLYIYKNTVEGFQWESAMDLFRAADKYQLLDLRKKCSFFLKSSLSVTNVCSILSLANMHEDDHLRKAAEYFISEHDNEVFISDAWKKFKMKNFLLAIEIMERIVLNRRN